jgi:ADP-ribose pyrophosphatase
VEAVITRGEGRAVEVLLGRLAAGSSKGLWDLPGGFLNAGDRIHEALVRECHREMDIGVRVGDLLGVFEEDSFYDIPLISIVFVCSIVAGTPELLISSTKCVGFRSTLRHSWHTLVSDAIGYVAPPNQLMRIDGADG